MNDEYFMNIAYEEAKKAYKKDEIPVGAILVENGMVLSKAHNKKDCTKQISRHAEIIAIEKAALIKKDWRLSNCTLYITMEPCPMCASAIQQSRIKRIVYACSSSNLENQKVIMQILNNKKFNHAVQIQKGILEEKCSKLLKKFFSNKR